ncbi:MAG: hypothetical protein WBK67_01475 [Minisyncoccales bacterium]
MTSPLDAVYEKYKHLDGCLSDPEWCTSGEGAAIYAIAGELWRAVKEARENPCTENGCTDTDNCDEICQHSRIYSPVQMQQAIAQATAAENKRVLDLADDRISDKSWEIDTHSDDGFQQIVYCSEIDRIIESLRLAQPEPTEREPE